MISGSELRKGIIIELDGKLYQVIDYQHIKMKRTALARVKLRDEMCIAKRNYGGRIHVSNVGVGR